MSKEVSDHNSLRLQRVVQIPGWTKEDKLKLHTGIKEFGSTNIVSLSTYLMKSPTEVRQAIEIYKERAKACNNQEKRKAAPLKAQLRNIPLDSWARLLMANSKPEQLQSETSNTIKIIAELEGIPKPNFTDNINFKNVYLTIADAMEGKPLKPYSYAQYLIHKCIIETAYLSKNYAKKIKLRNILEKAVEFETASELNFQRAEDLETSLVRKFVALESYNPLSIPLDALQTTIAQECKLFTKAESSS